MRIEPIVISQLLFFLMPAWLGYRILLRQTQTGLSPWVATLMMLVWLVLAPYGLLVLLVPFVNWLFITYPALEVGAWDVGVALALWLGMDLSYLVAVVIGVVAVVKFFWAVPGKENSSAY